MLFISFVVECRITKRESRSFIGQMGVTYVINNAVQVRKKEKKRKKERERKTEREKLLEQNFFEKSVSRLPSQ